MPSLPSRLETPKAGAFARWAWSERSLSAASHICRPLPPVASVITGEHVRERIDPSLPHATVEGPTVVCGLDLLFGLSLLGESQVWRHGYAGVWRRIEPLYGGH